MTVGIKLWSYSRNGLKSSRGTTTESHTTSAYPRRRLVACILRPAKRHSTTQRICRMTVGASFSRMQSTDTKAGPVPLLKRELVRGIGFRAITTIIPIGGRRPTRPPLCRSSTSRTVQRTTASSTLHCWDLHQMLRSASGGRRLPPPGARHRTMAPTFTAAGS